MYLIWYVISVFYNLVLSIYTTICNCFKINLNNSNKSVSLNFKDYYSLYKMQNSNYLNSLPTLKLYSYDISLYFILNLFSEDLNKINNLNFNLIIKNYTSTSTSAKDSKKIFNNYLFNFNNSFISTIKNNLNNSFTIKFAPSNMLKYVNLLNTNQYTILFLRKNKVFNKGRYSRNRQYYRTGVYWCLYINIVAVIGIYYWFYKVTFNFGYMWWLLYFFIASFIIPKAIKYRLYNLNNLVNSFYNDVKYIGFFFYNFISYLKIYLISILDNNSRFSKYSNFQNLSFNLFFLNKLNFNNSFYLWEYSSLNYYYNNKQSLSSFLWHVNNFFLNLFYFSLKK